MSQSIAIVNLICYATPMYDQVAALGCLGWCAAVALVTTIGSIQIFRHYSRPPARPISSHLQVDHVPHVTVIRPCKGFEPLLYQCLAATFHQAYPSARLTVHFCVSSKSDIAYEVLRRLVQDYPDFDTRIFVEEEDPIVQEQHGNQFGPNPKIRNMSRAYREAKGDVIWILDCNIWVSHGALGRMVDKLCGFTASSDTGQSAQTQRPYKLVAHLPVSVDVDDVIKKDPSQSMGLDLSSAGQSFAKPEPRGISIFGQSLTGSMLDASFLSTAHAKMYVAINSVSIAPCINGKSSMFRKSHLDHLTKGQGIDYFSYNICEDHLIGDLLWKSHISATQGFANDNTGSSSEQKHETEKTNPNALSYRNHGLAVGDLAVQPVAAMSLTSYIARRVRWLRVRKYTVVLATLVEPGTESLVCCAMGALSVTTLDSLRYWFGNSWTAAVAWFSTALLSWMMVDWFVSGIIQGMGSIETSTMVQARGYRPQTPVNNPVFAKPALQKRSFSKWLLGWVGREGLALGIWTWAVWGGATVRWRDKSYKVGMDMRVHPVPVRSSKVERKRS